MVVVVKPHQQQAAAVLGQEQEAGAHSKSAITQSGCGSLPLVPVNQSIASITCVPFLQPPQPEPVPTAGVKTQPSGEGRVGGVAGWWRPPEHHGAVALEPCEHPLHLADLALVQQLLLRVAPQRCIARRRMIGDVHKQEEVWESYV